MAAMDRSPRQDHSFLIFLAAVPRNHRRLAPIPMRFRVNRMRKERQEAERLLAPTHRQPRRKKAPCRRFLVSLGVRRRKSPTNLIGTKEIRHDEVLPGDSRYWLS